MASNITVDTLTKGSTTLNTDEIVDTNSSQVCKAWVNFNGTGTVAIRDSYNVSSITDNAGGKYVVNLTNAVSANSATATSGRQSTTHVDRIIQAYMLTSTTVDVQCGLWSIGWSDAEFVSLTVFGD
jgi:hypothetical protein